MRDQSEATGLISMTGFAAKRGVWENWFWTVDIRSVNGRGLDLRIRVPDWVEGLEPDLRKLLKAQLHRGSVTVSLRLQKDAQASGPRLSEQGLAIALDHIATIEEAAHKAGVSLAPTSATDISGMRGVLDILDTIDETPAGLKEALISSASECLDTFIADRLREGAEISAVIAAQIDRIETLVNDADATAGDREEAAKNAMQKALSRLLDTAVLPEKDRLAQELALIAVKNDVTEEIDRLHAHISAARSLMAETGAVGRKFDFLTQEFNREANTLCSKSQSSALTAIGLDLKAVVDQMREQVQNIE